MAVPTHYSHTVLKDQTFVLPTYYSDVKPLGLGAYGCVVKAKRTNPRTADETWLAIKKIKSVSFVLFLLRKSFQRKASLLLTDSLTPHLSLLSQIFAKKSVSPSSKNSCPIPTRHLLTPRPCIVSI
jgi:hypothetical protein